MVDMVDMNIEHGGHGHDQRKGPKTDLDPMTTEPDPTTTNPDQMTKDPTTMGPHPTTRIQ